MRLMTLSDSLLLTRQCILQVQCVHNYRSVKCKHEHVDIQLYINDRINQCSHRNLYLLLVCYFSVMYKFIYQQLLLPLEGFLTQLFNTLLVVTRYTIIFTLEMISQYNVLVIRGKPRDVLTGNSCYVQQMLNVITLELNPSIYVSAFLENF